MGENNNEMKNWQMTNLKNIQYSSFTIKSILVFFIEWCVCMSEGIDNFLVGLTFCFAFPAQHSWCTLIRRQEGGKPFNYSDFTSFLPFEDQPVVHVSVPLFSMHGSFLLRVGVVWLLPPPSEVLTVYCDPHSRNLGIILVGFRAVTERAAFFVVIFLSDN